MLTTLANFPWYKTLYVCMKKMLEWVGNIQVWLLQIIIKAETLEGIRYSSACLSNSLHMTVLFRLSHQSKNISSRTIILSLIALIMITQLLYRFFFFLFTFLSLPSLSLSIPPYSLFSLLTSLISAHVLSCCHYFCRLEEWWVSGPSEQKTGSVLRQHYC